MKSEIIEGKAYRIIRNFREPLFRPVAKFFALLGFRPEWLSYLGVIFMLIFIYFIKINPLISFYFLVAALLMDILDGSLARYLKIQSDRGKFTDVLVGNLNFTLFIIGMVWASLLSGLLATIYVYFMLIVKILMIIKKNIYRETDWLIRPMVGAFPNIFVFLSYATFTLYVFAGVDYIRLTSLFFSILLIIKAVADYWAIKTTVFTK